MSHNFIKIVIMTQTAFPNMIKVYRPQKTTYIVTDFTQVIYSNTASSQWHTLKLHKECITFFQTYDDSYIYIYVYILFT